MARADPVDEFSELMMQRRRWSNAGWWARDYVFNNFNYEIKKSSHSRYQVFKTKFMIYIAKIC